MFKTAAGAWILLSESAVYGGYCASHMNVLANAANTFTVKFPQTSLTGALPWTVLFSTDRVTNGTPTEKTTTPRYRLFDCAGPCFSGRDLRGRVRSNGAFRGVKGDAGVAQRRTGSKSEE